MSRIGRDKLQDELIRKKACFSIRATTFIHGQTKNQFLEDCIKRDFNESKMLAHVLSVYYSVINEQPELKEKEMTEVKQYLINKIKL